MTTGDRVRVLQQNQRGFPQWEETGIEGMILAVVGDTVLLDLGTERGYFHVENEFERVVPA